MAGVDGGLGLGAGLPVGAGFADVGGGHVGAALGGLGGGNEAAAFPGGGEAELAAEQVGVGVVGGDAQLPIGAAEDAAMQMNELNQIYNVDKSTYTILTQALHANSGQEVLLDRLAQSTPGEEVVLFNQVPDGNGGQPLPTNPLFGELVAGTPILSPPQVDLLQA